MARTSRQSPADNSDAIQRARRECRRKPDAAPPLFRLVTLLLERGDPEVKALLPRLERFPDYASGWNDIGEALLRHGKSDAALAAFDRALSAPSPPVAARLGRARCLMAADRAPEAVALLESAGLGDDARASALLGQALYAVGRPADAETTLARAVNDAPADAGSWYRLGLVRQDLHDPAGAARAYGEALRLRPDLHPAAFNLAVALQDAGDIDGAVDAYREAVRLDPDCAMRAVQSLTSAATGRLFLSPAAARRFLGAE